jgi:FdhD protein
VIQVPAAVRNIERQLWREDCRAEGQRAIPEETAIALTYNGGTYAVMMGTPQDLRDFAIGFSLNEDIVQSPEDILSLDIVELVNGIELRMWLSPSRAERLNEKRRYIAGPTGCGICGVESIAEAVRPPATVPAGHSFSSAEIIAAMASLAPQQRINTDTRSVHAAAFWRRAPGIVHLREDVGRHNALDKLAGVLAQQRMTTCDGMVLLTSRVSVEMVQKTAAIGAPLMVAVSAPTALAVRMAEAAGITLAAIARADGFEVFTHPERVTTDIEARKEAAGVA